MKKILLVLAAGLLACCPSGRVSYSRTPAVCEPIALASTQDPAAAVRAGLHARLRDVLAEQDDRARIAHA